MLASLRLDENALSGGIPSELGLIGDGMLLLDVSNNHPMNGTLPSELGLLKDLTYFIAHDTHIVGNIPPELGRLPKEGSLTNFHIERTLIYGEIPADLCPIEGLSFGCSGSLCGCDCTCGGQHVVAMSVNCLETPELCRR